MNLQHVALVARELGLGGAQVQATAELLGQGASVPFLARYRKEATGSLDEVAITAIRDRLAQLAALDARRGAIVASLEERNLLTDALRSELESAETLATLEDVYQPYRPKRRTRASVARDKGLEPLADVLFRQDARIDPLAEARRFVTPASAAVDDALRVPDEDAALQGARDILAERVTDAPEVRSRIRSLFWQQGVLRSEVRAGKADTGAKFKDYFDWSEPVARAPSHRVLAMLRGEAEEVLSISIQPSEDAALPLLERMFVRGSSRATEQVRLAVRDGYKRLLSRSMETETRAEAKQRADAAAIEVFAQNLRELLLAAPLGRSACSAIDPGLRTGCKCASCSRRRASSCIDTVLPGRRAQQRRREARRHAAALDAATYQTEVIAIGNGTGGRETESLRADSSLRGADGDRRASWSTSPARRSTPRRTSRARNSRTATSPCAARSPSPAACRIRSPSWSRSTRSPSASASTSTTSTRTRCSKTLDDVVESCVNAVGVELNTASQAAARVCLRPRLQRGEKHRALPQPRTAPSRAVRTCSKVPRSARRPSSRPPASCASAAAANPLDRSRGAPGALRPRRPYRRGPRRPALRIYCFRRHCARRVDLARYVTATSVGLPTLTDIVGRAQPSPAATRARASKRSQFRDGVRTMEDVKPGMKLPGVVTNVTAFGAFVDIGVHQDGLVHVSQLADRFVRDPNEVVHVQQPVEVTVLEVDLKRRRISLSLRTQ